MKSWPSIFYGVLFVLVGDCSAFAADARALLDSLKGGGYVIVFRWCDGRQSKGCLPVQIRRYESPETTQTTMAGRPRARLERRSSNWAFRSARFIRAGSIGESKPASCSLLSKSRAWMD